MTRDELQKVQAKLPLSAATLRRNSPDDSASGAKPQQVVRHEPLAAPQGTALYPNFVSVRITSFRTRLLDSDKLCATYFVDCLRYAGLISGDTASLMDYAIRQEKVASKSLERTEIELT
jgi:hypothetical protein